MSDFMAKVLGASGRYASQVATKRLHSTWKTGIVAMAVLGCLCGFMLRASFPWFTLPPIGGMILAAFLLVLFWLLGKYTLQRMDQLEKQRGNWLQGARGEKSVGFLLSKLPDAFSVINDISTGSGNLDHVVVGPTGVFVIETKNCRGVVDADNNGELTWNGKPAKQQPVGTLLRRTMGVKARSACSRRQWTPFSTLSWFSLQRGLKWVLAGLVWCTACETMSCLITL